MRNGEIIMAIMLVISLAIIALDTVVYLHKKRKGVKTHTENQNVEICVLCGSQMENESGRMYCKQCGKRWGNFD